MDKFIERMWQDIWDPISLGCSVESKPAWGQMGTRIGFFEVIDPGLVVKDVPAGLRPPSSVHSEYFVAWIQVREWGEGGSEPQGTNSPFLFLTVVVQLELVIVRVTIELSFYG